jgi:hypothetical protein
MDFHADSCSDWADEFISDIRGVIGGSFGNVRKVLGPSL